MKNLFGLNIKSEVMKVIKSRIADAQKKYDDEVDAMEMALYDKVKDINAQAEDEIRVSRAVHRADKEAVAKKHISGVIGKLF